MNGEKVQTALAGLVEKGKIKKFIFPEHLKDKSIDFFIVICRGACVPLQVETSAQGQELHRRKNPAIPSIRIIPLRSIKILEEKILRIVKEFKLGEALHL
jgi:hypothetical protein